MPRTLYGEARLKPLRTQNQMGPIHKTHYYFSVLLVCIHLYIPLHIHICPCLSLTTCLYLASCFVNPFRDHSTKQLLNLDALANPKHCNHFTIASLPKFLERQPVKRPQSLTLKPWMPAGDSRERICRASRAMPGSSIYPNKTGRLALYDMEHTPKRERLHTQSMSLFTPC